VTSVRRAFDSLAGQGWFLLGLAALVAVWALVTEIGSVESYVLPPPSDVATSAVEERSELLSACWVTVKTALLGFGLSVAVGVPLAFLIDASWRVERVVYPLLVATQVIPIVVFAPIFVLWFGFSTLPGILTVAVLCLFPVCVQTVDGLRGTTGDLVDLARSMGASRWRVFRSIKLPGALPSVFAGFKLAITVSLVGALVAEFVSSDAGLGRLLIAANSALDTSLLFAGVAYISVAGIALFAIVDYLERRAMPWHVSRRVQVLEGV
jgi:NitT/TauT family transport system permease protein